MFAHVSFGHSLTLSGLVVPWVHVLGGPWVAIGWGRQLLEFVFGPDRFRRVGWAVAVRQIE